MIHNRASHATFSRHSLHTISCQRLSNLGTNIFHLKTSKIPMILNRVNIRYLVPGRLSSRRMLHFSTQLNASSNVSSNNEPKQKISTNLLLMKLQSHPLIRTLHSLPLEKQYEILKTVATSIIAHNASSLQHFAQATHTIRWLLKHSRDRLDFAHWMENHLISSAKHWNDEKYKRLCRPLFDDCLRIYCCQSKPEMAMHRTLLIASSPQLVLEQYSELDIRPGSSSIAPIVSHVVAELELAARVNFNPSKTSTTGVSPPIAHEISRGKAEALWKFVSKTLESQRIPLPLLSKLLVLSTRHPSFFSTFTIKKMWCLVDRRPSTHIQLQLQLKAKNVEQIGALWSSALKRRCIHNNFQLQRCFLESIWRVSNCSLGTLLTFLLKMERELRGRVCMGSYRVILRLLCSSAKKRNSARVTGALCPTPVPTPKQFESVDYLMISNDQTIFLTLLDILKRMCAAGFAPNQNDYLPVILATPHLPHYNDGHNSLHLLWRHFQTMPCRDHQECLKTFARASINDSDSFLWKTIYPQLTANRSSFFLKLLRFKYPDKSRRSCELWIGLAQLVHAELDCGNPRRSHPLCQKTLLDAHSTVLHLIKIVDHRSLNGLIASSHEISTNVPLTLFSTSRGLLDGLTFLLVRIHLLTTTHVHRYSPTIDASTHLAFSIDQREELTDSILQFLLNNSIISTRESSILESGRSKLRNHIHSLESHLLK